MEKELKKILDAFELEDNDLEEFYLQLIEERIESTTRLYWHFREVFTACLECDLKQSFSDILESEFHKTETERITEKGYLFPVVENPELILKQFFNKDYYSVPEDPLDALEHLGFLAQLYYILSTTELDWKRFKKYLYLDRALLPLVQKLHCESRFMYHIGREMELSQKQQIGHLNKRAKIKQDCIEACHILLNKGKINHRFSPHNVCDVLIPTELKENEKFGDYRLREDFENGPKKSDLVIPCINTLQDYFKDII